MGSAKEARRVGKTQVNEPKSKSKREAGRRRPCQEPSTEVGGQSTGACSYVNEL